MNDLQKFITDKTNISACLECDCRNAYIEIEDVSLDFGMHWFRWCGVPEWYVYGFKEKCNPGIINSFEMVVIALEENTIHPIIAIQTMLQKCDEVITLLDNFYADFFEQYWNIVLDLKWREEYGFYYIG